MLKMLLDPMGGIVMTNDGNAILREIDVNHPAAKSKKTLCLFNSFKKYFKKIQFGKIIMNLYRYDRII